VRWLQRALTPAPAPPVNAIWEEISRRSIDFNGYSYSYEGTVTYEVGLNVRRDGIDCKVNGKGRTFDEALAAAWEKWPRA
jgi:hypothetical protein